jgi:predicted O-methyltransferase YrrM
MSHFLKTAYGKELIEMMSSHSAYDSNASKVALAGVIRDESVYSLQQLILENRPRTTLEIGMAMGMSTLAILYALQKIGGGSHVAIDPHQRAGPPDGYNGVGLSMVKRAGFAGNFEFLEQPSYLALPELVASGKRFDFIFIDGYHTFDFAFVDYFYSDLLLNDGGILVFDDVLLPMIDKVCWFLETHKAYARLGPNVRHPLNPFFRLKRRLTKRGTRGGDPIWGGLQAYRKIRSTTVAPLFFHTAFYPYFRVWWIWRVLRGMVERIVRNKKLKRLQPY